MQSTIRTLLVISVLAIPGNCLASWAQTTMEQKVCGAEVIVVGQLADIKKNYMTVTYNHDNDDDWSHQLDLGYIRDARILKMDGRARSKRLSVIFDSKEQPKNPFAHMTIPHSAGETGIWFLWKDRFSGSYIVQKPYSPLPSAQEKDVQKVIEEHRCQTPPSRPDDESKSKKE